MASSDTGHPVAIGDAQESLLSHQRRLEFSELMPVAMKYMSCGRPSDTQRETSDASRDMQNLASHLQGAGCLLSFGKLRDALAKSRGGRTIRFEPFEKEIWPLLKSLDIVGLFDKLYLFAPSHDEQLRKLAPGDMPQRERADALSLFTTVLFAIIPTYTSSTSTPALCLQRLEFFETALAVYSPDCAVFEFANKQGVPALIASVLRPAISCLWILPVGD